MVNQWLTHNGLLGRSSDGSVGKVLWIDGDFWCDPGHPSHFESLSCHHCSPPNLSSAPWWPGFSLLVFIPQFTQCVFCQFLFNHMLQYSTTHTYVYTQRYRHRIAASFSPKTKFDGSIDFSVTAQLRPPSGENPAVFGWWNCCRLVVIGFIGSSWSDDDALDSLEIWRLGYPLVMTNIAMV